MKEMSKYNYFHKVVAIVSILTAAQAWAADTDRDSLSVEIEMSGTVSNGRYAPMWTTANRFGMSGNESKNGYLSAEVGYGLELKHGWKIDAGVELGVFDNRLTFTEEQMKKETERCLGCGAVQIDEYMCVGCGMCVTKCNFDAIHLVKRYDGHGTTYEKLPMKMAGYMAKRTGKIIARSIKDAFTFKKD